MPDLSPPGHSDRCVFKESFVTPLVARILQTAEVEGPVCSVSS